jgi:hypothetical protein
LEDTVTFQAYLDNIKKKTGKSPGDFQQLASQKGFMAGGMLRKDIKVGEVVSWLKDDFGLGHGHAMAIVAVLKGPPKQ